jgi:hypothetical protein
MNRKTRLFIWGLIQLGFSAWQLQEMLLLIISEDKIHWLIWVLNIGVLVLFGISINQIIESVSKKKKHQGSITKETLRASE